MAYFAKIENDIVTEVIVINDEVVENKDFPESEPIGIIFCRSVYGEDTEWLQTSYESNFRGIYAGIGMVYNSTKDEFEYPYPITPPVID
jgi:hypothetical protein